MDPSDPSGNTVYVGGASGGIWKTTDFLTTNPDGPTWIPLTNFGPSAAINISSIAIFPRNDNPNQSIIIAATGGVTSGQEDTDAPGVGFLISHGRRRHLEPLRQHRQRLRRYTQVAGSGNLLPIDSTARNREFVGTTAYQVAVDPQLTPTGQVIIYAALSGTNGGIWRSENTGQTWTQVLAGNATAVVLDQDSGIVLDPTTGTDVQGNLQIVYAGIEGQGVFMSTNQGQSWTLMAGGVGNPLIVDATTGKNVNPASQPAPPTAPRAGSSWPSPPSTGNAAGGPDLRGLALRGRRHPERRLRRPVRHQGLRRELDRVQLPTPAPNHRRRYNQAVPHRHVTRPSGSRPITRSPTTARATWTSP